MTLLEALETQEAFDAYNEAMWALQKFAHVTGCPIGGNVINWLAAKQEYLVSKVNGKSERG